MIWHIFKKDARLLWPLAALVFALHVCAAIPRHLMDQGTRTVQLQVLGDLLSSLALLGVMVVAVVAMHQDPVPGMRQDWLVRPIRRLDLALAKLLFVLLMVQMPLWVADTGFAVADGFSLPAAGLAALGRNFGVFCEFALPAMMIGVITRTFIEAFIVAAIGLVLYICTFQVVLGLMLGVRATVGESGVAWLVNAAFDVVALIGTAAVLTLQYSGRRTVLARWLIGVGGAAIVGSAWVPWPMAFSTQVALSPQPGTAHAVAVAFDPQSGRYHLPLGAAPAITSALHLPLQFSGLPADSVVLLDRAEVRITGSDGTTLYQGKSNISVDGRGSMRDAQFDVRAGLGDGPTHSLYQRIYLPTDVYTRLANQQVRMSINYSLTLFGVAHHLSVPATGAHETLPGLGACGTGIDAEGDDVVIGCLSTSRQTTCYSAYLEHPATGMRNPEVHGCAPDYSPALINKLWPDSIYRTGGEVRFFDRSGMVHFPVDGAKLAGAKLVITTYEPRDHFTRHVDTPMLRLADLTGVASESSAGDGGLRKSL